MPIYIHPDTGCLFTLEKCDKCNADIRAPNSMKVENWEKISRHYRLERWHSKLPSEGYLMDTEEVFCEECYVHATL